MAPYRLCFQLTRKLPKFIIFYLAELDGKTSLKVTGAEMQCDSLGFVVPRKRNCQGCNFHLSEREIEANGSEIWLLLLLLDHTESTQQKAYQF